MRRILVATIVIALFVPRAEVRAGGFKCLNCCSGIPITAYSDGLVPAPVDGGACGFHANYFGAHLDISYNPSATITYSLQCSSVWAISMMPTINSCGAIWPGGICVMLDSDCDTFASGVSDADVTSSGGTTPGIYVTSSAALTRAITTDGEASILVLRKSSTYEPNCDDICVRPGNGWGGGVTDYQFESTVGFDYQVGSTAPILETPGYTAMTRSVASLSDGSTMLHSATTWQVGARVSLPPGWTDNLDGSASGSFSGSGNSGPHDFKLQAVQFDDVSMNVIDYDPDASTNGSAGEDVNRFNLRDINELTANSGTYGNTRFDLDGDGTLETTEIAFFQQFVDLEIDSGIFGDSDRDGNLDCADMASLYASVGSVLGVDADYNVALDFDLDGEVESAEWDRFVGRAAFYESSYTCFKRGDMDCNGVVSAGDSGPFATALSNASSYSASFPYCDPMRADMNDDGVLSAGDIGPFVDCITLSICP